MDRRNRTVSFRNRQTVEAIRKTLTSSYSADIFQACNECVMSDCALHCHSCRERLRRYSYRFNHQLIDGNWVLLVACDLHHFISCFVCFSTHSGRNFESKTKNIRNIWNTDCCKLEACRECFCVCLNQVFKTHTNLQAHCLNRLPSSAVHLLDQNQTNNKLATSVFVFVLSKK